MFAAKAAHGKSSRTAAAVVDPNGNSADTVNAVLPSAVLEGSDSDRSDDVSAPFRVKHLRWDCLLSGPLSDTPLPVRSLIDNGAHIVLVHPDVVEKTGLRR